MIAKPVIRNKEAFIQEQQRISEVCRIPDHLQYKEIHRSLTRPYFERNDVLNGKKYGIIDETSKPPNLEIQPSERFKLHGLQRSGAIQAESTQRPESRDDHSQRFNQRQLITYDNCENEEPRGTLDIETQAQTLPCNLPGQYGEHHVGKKHQKEEPFLASRLTAGQNRESDKRRSTGTENSYNLSRDSSSWTSSVNPAIRQQFEEMVVDEPSDMKQNPVTHAKYNHFIGQTDAFFIQYYLDSAVMTFKDAIQSGSLAESHMAEPEVLHQIREYYLSTLRHSELSRFNMNLDVTIEFIQQRVKLISKLGWRTQGFFELLDKHFPTI